ncbi:hypothetical protein [Virgibacillus doumboii]|uniref:hypothetical protein n=1 Tax=Virgibacillus doumboii TaxID=2697503 RepID=UPI0013DF9973|nr:hypothetical protein [Virgibacillus doumboii]
MKDWKQAFWLAKFEMKASKHIFPLLMLIAVAFALFLITSISSYLENNYAGFDWLFLMVFIFFSVWMKPKNFAYQRINNDLWASPSFVMFMQLPINKDIIIKSSFVVYYCYTLPIQLITLILFHSFSPTIQNLMSPGSYIAFMIIWLSIGVYFGGGVPVADAGYNANTYNTVLNMIVAFIALIVVFTATILISGHGVMHWTILFAQKWPVLSIAVSILLAVAGFKFWIHYMKKTMKKLDYL